MAEVANLTVGINAKTGDLQRGLKSAKNQIQSFGAQIKSIAATLGVAFAAREVIRFAGELIKLGGQAQGVRAAFEKLNDPLLLENLQRATRNTVSELELMRYAVQARNFKIPLDQLATYFEFATKRAIQTGESVDYLVQSIITGIGRKSVLVMDNLGISAVELQEEFARMGDFGAAAGEIIRGELESMGSVADTMNTKMAQLSRSWDDLKTSIGESLTDDINKNSVLIKLTELIDMINNMDESKFDKLIETLSFAITPQILTIPPLLKKLTPGKKKDISPEVLALEFLGDFKKFELEGKKYEDQLKAITSAENQYREKVQALNEDLDIYRDLFSKEQLAGKQADLDISMAIVKVLSEEAQKLKNINTEYGDYEATLEDAKTAAEKLWVQEKLLNDIYDARASMWQKAFGNIDITASDRKGPIDWSMIDPLIDEEKLDPEPYINFTEEITQQGKQFAQTMDFLNQQITQSFIGMADGIGSALGEMIATGEVGFAQFLQIAVDFAKQLAAILIAMGVAQNALVPGSGTGKIIAGIALGAVASGTGAYLQNRDTSANIGRNSLNVNVTGQTKISGNDIAVVYGRGSTNRNAMT